MNDIKLLLIGPLPPPTHGVAVMQETLANSDLRNQFHLSVFDIADRSKNALKTISKFSIQNALIGIWHCIKLFFLMMFERHDVVFMFLSQSRWGFARDAVFIRIARLFGAKVVINLGGSQFREFYESSPPGSRKRMRRTLNKISILQVLGKNLRPIFEGLVPSEKISVVPNGIAFEPYEGIADRRQTRPAGKSILFMGGLKVQKGVVELIEAFGAIADEFPDSTLRIAGAWFAESHKETILKAYDKVSHKNRIEFLGVVKGAAKKEALERADVFVLASYTEGQPVAILEAMACGLPVISCDKGAIADMVVDKKGGLIVESEISEALAAGLRTLFRDPVFMKKCGAFNITRFKESYTLSSFVEGMRKDIERSLLC